MDTAVSFKKANWKKPIAGLLAAVAVVSVVCAFLVQYTQRITKTEVDRFLTEISSQVGEAVNQRIETNYINLCSTAAAYSHMNSQENIFSYLFEQKKYYHYDNFLVVGSDYQARAITGETMDCSGVEAVQTAMNGGHGVSLFSSSGDQAAGFLYAVPLKNAGDRARVLAGWTSLDSMRGLISIENFNGEGFSQIIDCHGNFIVSSLNKNAIDGETNTFEALRRRGKITDGTSVDELEQALQNRETGMVRYVRTDERTHLIMCYRPLENGWYLLSIVPKNVANYQFDALLQVVIAIVAFILLFTIALVWLIVHSDKKNNQQVMQLAFQDPLTGGLNRTGFIIKAQNAIHASPPNTYVIILMDVQKFKLINDQFGTAKGDQVLRHIYAVMKSDLRKDEYICRAMGDQFELLLRYDQKEAVKERLNQIAEKMNGRILDQNRKYVLSFSAGAYPIDDPQLDTTLMRDRASLALKRAKASADTKRCCCVFYRETDHLTLMQEKDMENRMNDALENQEFIVYLQPKYSVQEAGVVGAEALVRWEDPEKGQVLPERFIPYFEKNKFIIKLDLYVFEQVCRLLRKWIDSGVTPQPISVNMSSVHLDTPDFLEQYEEIRKRYQVPASLLEIELTETLIFEKPNTLFHVIDEIHGYGYRCSLDDFGSGYSSLNVLKDINVDTLKLDRAFFSSRKMDNERERIVIRSVINMAKRLRMATVAEGVETSAQEAFLRETNCDMVQGFAFSKPLPPEAFETLVFGHPVQPAQ